MRTISLEALAKALQSLADRYDVRAPIAYPDGTRMLGRLDEGELAVCGGKVARKPTGIFFPQFGQVLRAKDGRLETPPTPEKPLLAVGFTAEDLDCLAFIDAFFSGTFTDAPYRARREGSIVVGVAGRCGPSGAFLRIADGHCDVELVHDGSRFIVVPHSEPGRALAGAMGEEGGEAGLEALRRESAALPPDFKNVIERASSLMRENRVPMEFWDEIGRRCIACSSCNLVCPTCTCFDVSDWSYSSGVVERHRIWDSCQLDGFQREGSGHNPMGTEGKRTLRRIHHKLVADLERWGHITCMQCGRCDDACPTGIGILAVSRDLVQRYDRSP